MAQTRKKRQTKHRGNAAGVVETRGRTSRPPSPEQQKREKKERARDERMRRPPSWRTATRNSTLMAAVLFIFVLLTHGKHGAALPDALIVAALAFGLYIPGGYYMEKFMWKRRLAKAPPTGVKRGR